MNRRPLLGYGSASVGAVLALALGGQAIAAPSPDGAKHADGVNGVAPADCEISRLPVPRPDERSLVAAGDPTGRYYVGYNSQIGGDGNWDMLLWEDGGEPTTLDVPDWAIVEAVNPDGVVVGTATVGESDVPVVFRDGQMDVLPGVPNGGANDINPNGDIVGYDESGEFTGEPIRWKAGSDKAERLSLPDDNTKVYELAVADDGTAVGVDFSDDEQHLYAWTPDGKRHELAVPEGRIDQHFVTVRGSTLVDRSELDDGSQVVYQWDLSDPTAEPSRLDTGIIYPHDVTADGSIAGEQGGIDEPHVPTLFTPQGGDTELPTLAGSTELEEGVKTLNDDGTILAGASVDENGESRAVRWTCTG